MDVDSASDHKLSAGETMHGASQLGGNLTNMDFGQSIEFGSNIGKRF